jgi:hypothetical protein
VPERRAAAERFGVETLDPSDVDNVADTLIDLVDGRGPEAVIDAVGMEARGHDRPTSNKIADVAQKLTGLLPGAVGAKLIDKAGIDRLDALLTAIKAVHRGGTLSIIGVYGGEAEIRTSAPSLAYAIATARPIWKRTTTQKTRPGRSAAGQQAVLVRGAISSADHCRLVIAQAVQAFDRIDVLVSNAAYQMTHESIEQIADEEWDYTIRTNVSAMFYLCKGGATAYEGRWLHHRQLIRQLGYAFRHPCSLCCDEGGDRQLLCQPCTTARRTGDSGE